MHTATPNVISHRCLSVQGHAHPPHYHQPATATYIPRISCVFLRLRKVEKTVPGNIYIMSNPSHSFLPCLSPYLSVPGEISIQDNLVYQGYGVKVTAVKAKNEPAVPLVAELWCGNLTIYTLHSHKRSANFCCQTDLAKGLIWVWKFWLSPNLDLIGTKWAWQTRFYWFQPFHCLIKRNFD